MLCKLVVYLSLTLTDNFTTRIKRIACETSSTTADRIMIDNLTACVGTTRIRAGIYALLSGTCSVLGAHGIVNTLRTAVWWCSDEIR